MLLISAWIPVSNGSKKPVMSARKEDIPYIKCQVCEKLAAQLYHQVQKKQAEISPKKISEYQIIEITENVCNLKKAEADWILQIDIVEQGNKLELVEQEVEGHCNSECKTIERACQEVMGYSDTDVAEYLYTAKPQIDSLVNFLCKDLSKACSTKPPPLPKGRTPGEPFVPKSSKEAEMEKMMRSMEGMPGAPGMKMYSRDDLMNMNNLGGDDDEEDDDDEADFPSNLGKVLRQKESKKGDWRQKITTGIVNARDSLKKHAYKVSNRVRQWWRKKAAGSKNLKDSKSDL
uniref:Saposin B-type domain-containing protein n=1 Tax=Fagus sylvatica TaxID=28930 RepID=A0A2N9G5T5_FAGSY